MKYTLRLYVTGRTLQTQQAIENVNALCHEGLGGEYDIEAIDVLENPHLAEDEKILATPTLVRSLPLPSRKIIGDLGNRKKVLSQLMHAG